LWRSLRHGDYRLGTDPHLFIHADLPWTLGLMGKVLMSPAAHRLS
jgi:hypothetical protein